MASYVNDKNLWERITINPKVMAGKPVIHGTRLSVEYILGLLANGTTIEEILEEYPGLVKDDIRAAVQTCPHLLEEMIDERKKARFFRDMERIGDEGDFVEFPW
jgi:uncharacterized protein (DUF433 family)